MRKKMRAAVFEGNGILKIKEVDKPTIQKPDDLIVEVDLCSICGTDVHIMEVPPGYIAEPGTILGHELVGKVVETGDNVTTIKVGDRVVTNPNDYCGVCKYCQYNLPNMCENIIPMGIGADGGFAEYVRASEKVTHKISDNLSSEIAAFAEPLACLVNGKNKIPVSPGDSVLIIGQGTIGLMFTQMMKASGASVIVSEPAPLRREYAKKCGADFIVNPFEMDLEQFIYDHFGIGVDYAIDVVGSQIWEGIQAVRKGGTVLLFGFDGKAKPCFEQYHITNKEIAVLGTWIANTSFPQAVKILESGVLNLKPLITHTLPLDKTAEGIEILRKGEGIEILINPKL